MAQKVPERTQIWSWLVDSSKSPLAWSLLNHKPSQTTPIQCWKFLIEKNLTQIVENLWNGSIELPVTGAPAIILTGSYRAVLLAMFEPIIYILCGQESIYIYMHMTYDSKALKSCHIGSSPPLSKQPSQIEGSSTNPARRLLYWRRYSSPTCPGKLHPFWRLFMPRCLNIAEFNMLGDSFFLNV